MNLTSRDRPDTNRPRRLRHLAAASLAALLGLGLAGAQERPLPDVASVLKELRRTLHTDRVLLSSYTYTQKNTEYTRDKQGRITKTEVEIREMYPSVEDELSYARLISKNGKPVDPKELARKDREQQEKVLEWARHAESDSAGKKQKRLAKTAEERRKENEAIEEAFALYAITIKGREMVDGHETLVLDFRPRPDYKIKTDIGKILRKVAGRAWINERDSELVRLDVDVIDTISVGFGMARLNKGAHAMFQRRLVNNEIWLPAEVRFTGSARVLLVKGMRLDVSSEYSGYKKFSVDTTTSFAPPAPAP